jgi:hypothetical protein
MCVSPPIAKPCASSPRRRYAALSASARRRSGSRVTTSSAAPAAATAAGASPVVKMKLRARFTSTSINAREPAMYAPALPSALPSVPICTGTRAPSPSASTSPAP